MTHGTYEELWDEAERDQAFARITDQGKLAPPSLAPYTGHLETMVVYRIRIAEKTGRFEHDDVLARHTPALAEPDERDKRRIRRGLPDAGRGPAQAPAGGKLGVAGRRPPCPGMGAAIGHSFGGSASAGRVAPGAAY
jgi:hypothetical protein